MNVPIIPLHLEVDAPAVIARWSRHFTANAVCACLPVSNVRPDSFPHILSDLVRIMDGEDLARFQPIRQRDILFETSKGCSKLPLLVELFVTLEETLRDDLRINEGVQDALNRRIRFEELSGAIHLLFQVHLEVYCDSCLEPMRETCAELLNRRALPELMAAERRSHQAVDLPADSAIPPTAEVYLFELGKFLQSHSSYLYAKWISEAASSVDGADALDPGAVVTALLEILQGNRENDPVIAAAIMNDHASYAGFSDLVKLCHIGEETIALFLAEVPERHSLRIELNKAFHSIIRANAFSSCARCRRRIEGAEKVLAEL